MQSSNREISIDNYICSRQVLVHKATQLRVLEQSNFVVLAKLILFEKDSFLELIISTMQVTAQRLRKIDTKAFNEDQPAMVFNYGIMHKECPL